MLPSVQVHARPLAVCAFEDRVGWARAGLVDAGPDGRLYKNQRKRLSAWIPFPYHTTLVVSLRAGYDVVVLVIMSSTWEPT